MRTLTVDEARAFYDRFGAKQDRQAFYERPALAALVANARFGDAQFVFEFGCGTGSFAATLLQNHLSPSCRYLGIDISSTMVRLASERLAQYAPRASAVLASADPVLPLANASADRFIATYVLDLLSESAAIETLDEARRVLGPGGLLCLAGITHGVTATSKAIMSVWQSLFARNPNLVGGCRPTRLNNLLPIEQWGIRYHDTVESWGVASEVVVAFPQQALSDA